MKSQQKSISPSCCCLHGEETLSSQHWDAEVARRLLIAVSVLSLWPRKKYKGSYFWGLQHKHRNDIAQPFKCLCRNSFISSVKQCFSTSMGHPRCNYALEYFKKGDKAGFSFAFCKPWQDDLFSHKKCFYKFTCEWQCAKRSYVSGLACRISYSKGCSGVRQTFVI